jgi:hypothetical protein
MSEKLRKKKESEPEKYDILQLDDKIKRTISEECKKLPEYQAQLQSVVQQLIDLEEGKMNRKLQQHKEKLEKEKVDLIQKIEDIEANNAFSEYIYMSEKIISEYITLSSVPKNVSSFFTTKSSSSTTASADVKYEEIISQFMELAKKYIPIKTYKKEVIKKPVCGCGNTKDFTYTDNTVTCDNCAVERNIYSVQTTYKDTDRVNLSQKYRYKRRVHFRDTLNQYQGKQNKKIAPQVLDDLENEFQKLNLIDNKGTTFHEKHRNITKGIIYMLLSETGHNNHYEDLNLLHNYFTGIPCPDVSQIEEELFSDFDKIVEVYDSMKDIHRKNFLNSQFILYQLLKRRNVRVREDDFDILKSRDRLLQHEEIFQKICVSLEWTFCPLL